MSSTKEPSVVVTRPAYNIALFDKSYKHVQTKEKPLLQQISYWGKSKLACNKDRLLSIVYSFIPVLVWLPKYKLRFLPGDLIAGWTVGIIRIPQGMAYALLANVAPVYGLYSCFFPVLLWFVFSTSKHTSIGTMAVVCLMIQNIVDKYVPETDIVSPVFNNSLLMANGHILKEEDAAILKPYIHNVSTSGKSFDSAQYVEDQLQIRSDMRIQIASSATLLVGIIQLIMGGLRLGFLTKFLSDPVVQGFTTGTAFHVMFSQLKYMFGFNKEIGKYSGPFALVKILIDICKNFNHINYVELVISVICLPTILIVKHFNEKYKKQMKNIPFPIELVLVIAGTLASHFGKFNERYHVNIVAKIPTGLPSFSLPPYTYLWGEIVTDCIIMAVIGFAISLSLTKVYSDKHGYEIDANQELIALGICNTIPAFLSSFAIAASLSRTAIQESSGGNTQLVSVLSSVLMLIVLLWLGPLFEPVPKSILACIIIVALKGLFMQFQKLKPLWQVSKVDFAVWSITLFAVIFLGVDIGLAVGVSSALFALLFRIQRPKHVILGRVPYSDIYADISSYTDAEEVDGIKIFRFTDSPCFNNKDLFKELLCKSLGFNPTLILAKKLKIERKSGNDEEGGMKSDTDTIEMKVVENTEATASSSTSRFINKEDSKVRRRNVATDDQESTQPLIQKYCKGLDGLHTLIIDASMWSFIDSTAARELSTVMDILYKIGIQVLFASLSDSARTTLECCSLDHNQIQESSFLTIHDACVYAERSFRLSQRIRSGVDGDEYELYPGYPGFDALAL